MSSRITRCRASKLASEMSPSSWRLLSSTSRSRTLRSTRGRCAGRAPRACLAAARLAARLVDFDRVLLAEHNSAVAKQQPLLIALVIVRVKQHVARPRNVQQ